MDIPEINPRHLMNKYQIIDYVKIVVVAEDLTIVQVKDFKKKNPVKWHLTVVPIGYSLEQTVELRKGRI